MPATRVPTNFFGTITNKKAIFARHTYQPCRRLGRDRLEDVGFRSSIQPTIFERCAASRGKVETPHVGCLLLGYRTEIQLWVPKC